MDGAGAGAVEALLYSSHNIISVPGAGAGAGAQASSSYIPGTGASATEGAGARRVKDSAPRRLPNLEGDGDRSAGDGAPEDGGDPVSSGGAGPGVRRAKRAARPAGLKLPKRVGEDPPELGGDASPGAGGAGAGCTRAAGAGRGSVEAIRPAAPRLRRPADRRGDGRPWPGLPSGILLASMRAGLRELR